MASERYGREYPEILTTAMAAEMLQLHVEYLRKLVREGRIPAHRIPGGREIRFFRDELIAWLRSESRPATPPPAPPARGDRPAVGDRREAELEA